MKKQELIDQIIASNSEYTQDTLKAMKLGELRALAPKEEVIVKSTEGILETDDGWSDYVMSQFAEKELKQEMPTCDGLRRVFKKLIGDIISSEMSVIKAPTTVDPTSSVMCTISYKKDTKSPIKKISDVFDVNQDNTPWPYCKSSVGTAATKAEARALRKGLGLVRVYAAEEIQEGMNADEMNTSISDVNRPISDNAKTAINIMSTRLGIKPSKLLVFIGIEKAEISMLSYNESHIVLAKLNSFSRTEANGGESIPDSIKSTELTL